MTAGEALQSSRAVLVGGLAGMASRMDDCERVARVVALLGVHDVALEDLIVSRQQRDGGWSSIEATAWCCAVLSASREDASDAGLRWLSGQRLQEGGWGATRRDSLRIPLTGLILRLHGHLIGERRDWAALEDCWAQDLASPVSLTYKGAFYLLCQSANDSRNRSLERQTIEFLESNANADGGIGPWLDHPIGSDPWSTGVCLAGLCRFPGMARRDVIEDAVRWLVGAQLPSGYWRYHYIDEGTAYAYWGLSEAISLLEDS
jgi:hypothetical protein